ncbi:MAG: RNA polymerase sigma factor [Acidimicrobiia bacterium]|nr:RNA polymerase sigma factor [Acidimicrobiia bacterium]
MDELDDATLVALSKEGDQRAFGVLVRRHQASVARLAGFVSGSFDAAEDITQETFVKAYRALDRFQDGAPFRPWILRIAANTAKNHRRSLGRKARLSLKVAALPTAGGTDPADQVAATATVADALARLNPDDRLVVTLRYFEDLSERDMATALACAPGTVKSRLARAMGRLRAEMGGGA